MHSKHIMRNNLELEPGRIPTHHDVWITLENTIWNEERAWIVISKHKCSWTMHVDSFGVWLFIVFKNAQIPFKSNKACVVMAVAFLKGWCLRFEKTKWCLIFENQLKPYKLT